MKIYYQLNMRFLTKCLTLLRISPVEARYGLAGGVGGHNIESVYFAYS